MPENGGGERMSVTSGRRCSALLTKSGQLGSLVKMLLESPLWWKEGFLLTWDVVPLYSRRVTDFTDMNLTSPSPLNESATTLNTQDIPSSRCLFRLRVLAHPTEEIESSLSPGMRNLLPTPLAVEREHPERVKALKEAGATKINSRVNGEQRPNGIIDHLMFYDLLPTPTAGEGEKYCNKYNPDSQMGKSLSAMAGSGMLPTHCAHDARGKTNPGQVKEGSGCVYGETLPDTIGRITEECYPETDGPTSRLSPLFTEEMMGFPLMWTAFPFLQPDGEPKP